MVNPHKLIPLLALPLAQQSALFQEAKGNYTRCIGEEASSLIDFTTTSLGELAVIPKANVAELPREGINDVYTQCMSSLRGVMLVLIHKRGLQNVNGDGVIKYYDRPGGSQLR